MGQRTAVDVVTTAEAAVSVCSSNFELVFTPIVPVDPDSVGDDLDSGARSRARYREDDKEYVSHPRALCGLV